MVNYYNGINQLCEPREPAALGCTGRYKKLLSEQLVD